MPQEINYKDLTDSPYSTGANSDMFFFEPKDVNSLVNDLLYGNPTCYLVSGYRGAGKSSFIRRVENTLNARQRELLNEIKKETAEEIVTSWLDDSKRTIGTFFSTKTSQKDDDKFKILQTPYKLFVHSNFAKYESQTYLLRKLIRGLYYSLEENKALWEYLKDYDKKQKNINKHVLSELKILFDRTFQEVTKTYNLNKEFKKTTELKVDNKKAIQIFIKGISSFIVLIIGGSNAISNWLTSNKLISVGVSILAGVQLFLSFIEWKTTISSSEQEKEEFNRKTLYDDEIAGYHFKNILEKLRLLNIEFIFVFDELDKVNEAEVDKLIDEMKPHLVSGLASYVVVAGQSLYYRYYFSNSSDDAVLSSLFSRVVHVPLLIPQQLSEQFRIVCNISKSSDKLNELQPYIDYLIFKSKRVPRKFINLIRQNAIWDERVAEINYENKLNEFKDKYSKVLAIIQEIYESEIAGNYEDSAIRDYLHMQLFIKAEKILSQEKEKTTYENI